MIPQTKLTRPASDGQLAPEAWKPSDQWKRELTLEERAHLAGLIAVDVARDDAASATIAARQMLRDSPVELALKARVLEADRLQSRLAELRSRLEDWAERDLAEAAVSRDALDEFALLMPRPSEETRRSAEQSVRGLEIRLAELREMPEEPTVRELALTAEWQRLAVGVLAGAAGGWTQVATLFCGIVELRAADMSGDLSDDEFQAILARVSRAVRGEPRAVDRAKAMRALANWRLLPGTLNKMDDYELLLRKGLLACGLTEGDARSLFSAFAKRSKRNALKS